MPPKAPAPHWRIYTLHWVRVFAVWEDGEGAQFVCKVETPPGDPLSSQPPWRWWSSLFRTREELAAQMATMVARRVGREGPAEAPAASEGASAAAP